MQEGLIRSVREMSRSVRELSRSVRELSRSVRGLANDQECKRAVQKAVDQGVSHLL